MIEGAACDLLRLDEAVQARSNRGHVHVDKLPQRVRPPYAVVLHAGTATTNTFGGEASPRSDRLTVECWGGSRGEALRLATAVGNAARGWLNRQSGVWLVLKAFFSDGSGGHVPEPAEDAGRWVTSVDFTVWYRQAGG